jgi:hypothetical protein
MVPGTIRLCALWVALSMLSVPGITLVSSVAYGLNLPLAAGWTASFWHSVTHMTSLELAYTVAAIMTLKLWLWYRCYRRTFRWAGDVLKIRRDVRLVQDSGLLIRIRTQVEGPLLANHAKLVARLEKVGRSTALPVSMGIIPFSGSASLGSLILAVAGADRKFAVLAATNYASVFTATLFFRELVLARLFGLR